MSTGATKEYHFGNKNNWRRWQWNQILTRLKILLDKPAKDAIVLYLAGKDDLDRPIALQKGFKNENLIAIDRDTAVIKELKENRVLAINGSASEVIFNWPTSRTVDVLLLDFCGGLGAEQIKVTGAIGFNPAFSNCIVAANLLRGRDAISNTFRDQIKRPLALTTLPTNHRGAGFAAFSVYLSRHAFVTNQHDDVRPMLEQAYSSYVRNVCTGDYNSYNSGNLTFDSAVFMFPSYTGFASFVKDNSSIFGFTLAPLNDQQVKHLRKEVVANAGLDLDTAITRSITALMAVRTMRLNAG